MNSSFDLYLLGNQKAFEALEKTKTDFLSENQMIPINLDALKKLPEHRPFKMAKAGMYLEGR